MANQPENGPQKGKFGRLGFPVAKRYPGLPSRTMLYAIGAIGALLIGGLFLVDGWLLNANLVNNGPLSSNHASFGGDCQSCHTPGQGVPDQKCMVCHEKFGDDLGIHSFEAHYIYRSGDFSRVVPSVNEVSCATCHNEHQGTERPISMVADAQCATCHDIDGFNDNHPEFEFAREDLVDEAQLKFPHTLHVAELQQREGLVDIEKACLYCHDAEPDGKGFEPIDFETDCDACHLSTSSATEFVPLARTGTPGVQSINAIATAQRAGTRWAYFSNPGEFQERGNTVRKRPVYHADPWIMENLKLIRNTLYPSENLSGLLLTSADVASHNTDILYEEAISTLRTYVDELRDQPDRAVQAELQASEQLLAEVEQKLQDRLEPRDETQFLVSAASLNPDLSTEDVEAYQQIVANLSQPCLECHEVEQATIQRVQSDQQSLIRAEFDHAAHIIQARCLDCHNQIPIASFAALDSIPPPELDRAEIHNLPQVASCQSCHDTKKAANTCITCHEFHPDTSQRSNLLLYID